MLDDWCFKLKRINLPFVSFIVCRYARGKYGLAPEYVKFKGSGAKNVNDDFVTATDAPYYILRPETAETFFILYHLTKDNVYREWGWEIFRAIDASCRTGASLNRSYFKLIKWRVLNFITTSLNQNLDMQHWEMLTPHNKTIEWNHFSQQRLWNICICCRIALTKLIYWTR
jgi:hypothetical protein